MLWIWSFLENTTFAQASVTESGLKIRVWLERLVDVLVNEERAKEAEPAFCHANGLVMRPSHEDAEFHEALRKVQASDPELIDPKWKVEDMYHVFCSFRRGDIVRATELKFPLQVIELNNRWRNFEKLIRKGKAKLRELCIDIRQTLDTHLSFSLYL